jgi:hypothetical protein
MNNKVTVILNVYKRPQYLKEQIEAFKNQTVPCDIWIDYTVPEGEQMYDLSSIAPNAKITTRTNQNLFHIGRFFYGLNVQSKYVFICDDDIIPGKNYLQYCINIIENEGNCILTGYGLKFDRNIPRYHAIEKYGWHSLTEGGFNESKEVDMAGHSWFMKRSSLSYITREIPYSFENGEDLFFSYVIQKYGNIPIKVPPHKPNEPENWSCDPNKGMKMGNDNNATWRQSNHTPIRDSSVKHYLDNGWKLVNDR